MRDPMTQVKDRGDPVRVVAERLGAFQKPVSMGIISGLESFNGKLQDECHNETLFGTLRDARKTLAVWRYDYNNVRSLSSLCNNSPHDPPQPRYNRRASDLQIRC